MGGDNLGKMAKNCMKITKSAFWGQNSWGDMGGGQANFLGSWGIPPVPPTRGNPALLEDDEKLADEVWFEEVVEHVFTFKHKVYNWLKRIQWF